VSPSITSLNPSSGTPSGGNQVTITGSGLTGASSVKFGSTSATFTILSDTQIRAIAPPGSGTVQVTVTTPTGTSNGLPYSYSAPSLASLNPTSGPGSGGNTVTLTGTNLAGVTAVHFGANLAAFTVVSNTQINAIAPAGSGIVAVNVSAGTSTSNSLPYTYVPAPTLTSINPTQGPLPGGNLVTLTGTGLTEVAGVFFGSVPASSFTIVDSTHITAVAPGGNPAGPVQVTVTTPSGTSNAMSYFYVPAPVLTDVSPTQGPTAGGNTVTLTGSGFTGTTSVHFGAGAAPSFTVVTDNQLTVHPPAGTGTIPVTVTTAGGTSSGTISYTYLPAAVLTSLIPNQGPATGGNSVTLTGTGLTFTSTVSFAGTPAPFTVISDTQVVALAPAGPPGPVTVTATTPSGTSNGLTYTHLAAPGT
jgi:hypothetical protein